MNSPTTCPQCGSSHTLSNCPRWIIGGRPSINAGSPGKAGKDALMGEGALPAAARPAVDLRATMPLTAALVDELRAAFGRPAVDAMLKRCAKGQARAYFAELGADGQLREWGRAPSGTRAVVVAGGLRMGGAACSR